MAHARDEAGFALLIVLWSTVLLALIVSGIAAAGRTDTQLASNLRGAAVVQQAADGAVFEAVFHLLDPVRPWPADGRPREVAVPGAMVDVRIEDQAGKVNPNAASRELLRALLQASGASQAAADALAGDIVDWRFPRIQGGAGLVPGLGGGAEPSPGAQRYRAAGLDYAPPGAPFETLDELGLVLGMTPDLLTRLRPHLSLLTDDEPDYALADPAVQAALRFVNPAAAAPHASAPPRNVSITATATAGPARFTRHAALRLGRSEKEATMTTLSWQ